MHTRRFTRLTNAFSKKVENHFHAVALFALYYNFVRIHKTLRTTPAMAAGVTKRLWEIGDIVDLLEAWEKKAERQRGRVEGQNVAIEYHWAEGQYALPTRAQQSAMPV